MSVYWIRFDVCDLQAIRQEYATHCDDSILFGLMKIAARIKAFYKVQTRDMTYEYLACTGS